MAFDFGSDILVDAMKAADPRNVEAVRQNLSQLSQSRSVAKSEIGSFQSRITPNLQTAREPSNDAHVLQKFEAAILTTFIQQMMPKNASSVFGEGLAGDMWKSQMAERIADQMSQRGGIGIAGRLLKDFQKEGDVISSILGVSDPQTAVSESSSLDSARRYIQTLELNTLSPNRMDREAGNV